MHIVVLSGAGVSAESGLPTFRGDGGLWEEKSVYELATVQGFLDDPETVLRFYNHRRQQVRQAQPNAGHLALAELERHHQVSIVTQNIDDLHERAGSTRILHLHGLIMQGRSALDPSCIVDLADRDIAPGEKAPDGMPLRPNVVWFGEDVPLIAEAADWVAQADVLIVVGTSLQVYPAANLIHAAPNHADRYLVDPNRSDTKAGFTLIAEGAATGLPKLVSQLTG